VEEDRDEKNDCRDDSYCPVGGGTKARIMLGHVAFSERPSDQEKHEPESVVDSDGNPNYSTDVQRH